MSIHAERAAGRSTEPAAVRAESSRARRPPRIQRRLRVGSVADPSEVEADRVADDVMRRLAGGLGAPWADTPGTGRVGRVASATASPAASPGGPDGGDLDEATTTRIRRATRGGAGLDGPVRTHMEAQFGADLSAVRVHADREAADLSHQLGARAFTVGSDVFFGRGEYRPGTAAGDRLVAHELTHVVQQGGELHRSPDETIRRDDDPVAAARFAADTAIAQSMLKSSTQMMGSAASQLQALVPMIGAAVAQPPLMGAVTSMAGGVHAMLEGARNSFGQAMTSWNAIAGRLTAPGLAPLVSMLQARLTDVEQKFLQWPARAAAISPGATSLATSLAVELRSSQAVIDGLGNAVFSKAVPGRPSPPTAQTASSAPAPVPARAPSSSTG